MALNDIVNVTITLLTSAPTRVGFGVPCLLTPIKDSYQPDIIAEYNSLQELIDTGAAVTDLVYLMAAACFSQNPRPDRVVVVKLQDAQIKKAVLTPLSVADDTEYNVIYNGVTVVYDSGTSATLASICTGLAIAINGATGSITADGSSGTEVELDWADVNDNDPIYVEDRTLLEYKDITEEGTPTSAESLAEAQLINDDFYCVLLSRPSNPIVTTMSTYIEASTKIMIIRNRNTDVLDPAITDDIASALQAGSAFRTAIIYHSKSDAQFPDCAWAGVCLPSDPGSITWKFKTLAGITNDTWTGTEVTTLTNKGANMYLRIAGLNMTQEGVMCGGEFIDVVRSIDWTRARLQENVYALLKNAPKVPYTDPGVAQVENVVRGVLQEGEDQGIYTADPKYTVTVPKVADVPFLDKANRLLPDVNFTATLAGAIHAVEINGTVSV